MIRTDSRKVRPGDTFIAIDGIMSNGSDYIENAVNNGASCVVTKTGTPCAQRDGVRFIYTADTVRYLEDSLKEDYGDIVNSMTLIGVTGTNGKTTVCSLISQLLNRCGIKCAYIGTIGFYMDKKIRDLPNTSVDLCSLYELLLECHGSGFDHVALEASSQGLDMGRLNTITFSAAVFTNLTEDHLDYHKNMENYAIAKRMLFKALRPDGFALLNSDDPSWEMFRLSGNRNFTYGTDESDFRLIPAKTGLFRMEHNGHITEAKTSLFGSYNMYNILAAAAVCMQTATPGAHIAEQIPYLAAPEGRCEVIRKGTDTVIIDYAHTPDAMEKIISSAKELAEKNIYIVFGCTGDREREKRPVMTQTALKNCKKALITADDPHYEDLKQIFEDMLDGNELANYEIIPDRKEAIRRGLEMLEGGDILLILGKGHEKFINCGDVKIPHNDKEAVLELIV